MSPNVISINPTVSPSDSPATVSPPDAAADANVDPAPDTPIVDVSDWPTALPLHACPRCGAEGGCRHSRTDGVETWACRHTEDHLAARAVDRDGAAYSLAPDAPRYRRAAYAEVLRTVEALQPPGVFEVRVLGLRDGRGRIYTASGYFDDIRAAAREAVRYDTDPGLRPAGIYLLTNEIDPALLARSPNKIAPYPGSTTSDHDVVRRRLLLLDFDPDRPSGVPASATQLVAATRLAQSCRRLLCDELGWPAPAEAMSGNGAYLLYGLDLPAGNETDGLISGVLRAVSHRLGSLDASLGVPAVHLDTSTHNRARLVRLLGTVNRKGRATADLPHRRSRLLSAPDRLMPVPPELLHNVVREWLPKAVGLPGTAPSRASRPGPTGGLATTGHRLKVEDWLRERGVGYRVKSAPDCHGRTVYLLDQCPFDPSHGACKEVAIYQHPNGKPAARCMHQSCATRGWQDFKAAIGPPDPGHYDPPLRPGRRPAPAGGPEPGSDEHLTDLGNARRLVRRSNGDLRHCFLWKKDMVWDGTRWAADDTALVERWAKEAALSIYDEAATATDDDRRVRLARHAKSSESAHALAAMMKLARSEAGVPVLPSDFDRDSWSLNVANGTLDLRAGTLRPHRREDLHTKIAPVAYDPEARCPTWDAFLMTIMGGNARLVDYLRRVIGYGLTGDVSEQALWALVGSGANGKSTFVNTVLATLGGEYTMQAAPELLMVRQGEAHPTERADLFGKRLVTCIESEQGARLAEALVKQLTGGERIRARRMREDFWEFDPTFKLMLATNHKPAIRGSDHGIWRRVKLVPFTVTIPETSKDPHLSRKLAAERSGILAWAVRGCLEWQRDGMQHPPEVAAATEEYRAEMDTVGAFLTECCRTGADEMRVRKTDLYKAYLAWAAKGEGLSRNDFTRTLEGRGFRCRRSAANGADQWHGLALRWGGGTETIDGLMTSGLATPSEVVAKTSKGSGKDDYLARLEEAFKP